MCQKEAGVKCPWDRQTGKFIWLGRQGAWRKSTERRYFNQIFKNEKRKNPRVNQMESKQRRQCDPRHGTMNLYGNLCNQQGFPRGSMIKEFACQCRRHRFNPWVGKFPGKGNGYPLQDSCLGNPMGSRVWLGTVHGVAEELDMTEWLSLS